MNEKNPVGEIRPPWEPMPQTNQSPPSYRWSAGAAADKIGSGSQPVSPSSPATGTSANFVQPKIPFCADTADIWFAAACVLLGYCLISWGILFNQGISIAIFTLCYSAAVLGYAGVKRRQIPRESWFWLGALLCCGLSCALWEQRGFSWVRVLFLLGTAVYWVLSLTGCQVEAKTGNWMALDLGHGLFPVAFGNFDCLFRAFGQGGKRVKKARALLGILLGLALCIPVLGVVLPLLAGADQEFGRMLTYLAQHFLSGFWSFIFQLALAVPVACYLFGLIAGCMHRRKTSVDFLQTQPQPLSRIADKARRLPFISVCTLLGIVCAVYLLFICMQARYLFSAFAGLRPADATYAEYARQGFFELCKAAGFNAAILFLCNCLSRKARRDSRLLRLFNLLLSVLTLLLIAAAMSKMILYVKIYGLSQKRLLTCYFMFFLAGVYLLVIFMQARRFSVVRATAALGTVMFVVLCLINVDGFITKYNLNRYENGTLPSLRMDFLYDCGYGGVDAAEKLYTRQSGALDSQTERELAAYLASMRDSCRAEFWEEATLQSIQARVRLGSLP